MADKSHPPRHPGPRMSYLQSEPISMSFASPQQLAQLSAAAAGGYFPHPQMKTQSQTHMPAMSSGINVHNPNYQSDSIPKTTTNAAAAPTSPQPISQAGNKLQPLAPQKIALDTFKGFKFITLDPLQIETRDVYDKISGTFQWDMCESQEDRCIGLIRDDYKNKRIFFVSSGSLGAKIVPQIHELPQVYAIYIYCANVKFHQEWAKQYPKVRIVCDNDDLYLLPLFAVDVAQSNVDWGNAFLEQGARDKAKEKYQLAFDKLNNYARNHDPAMGVEVKNKLEKCK
jgi:hypothetical protein